MFKKLGVLLICVSSLLLLSCVSSSCSKNQDKEPVLKDEIYVDSSKKVKESNYKANIVDPESLFTLDYTPYMPEEIYQSKKLNVKYHDSSKSNKKYSDKNTSSIIPGLRDITKYETKYNTDPAVAADLIYNDTITGSIAENASVEKSNNENFTIVTWGPQAEIPAAVREPEFYIMFSEPVVPIAALGSEIKTTDIVKISPPLPGVYRWNGTSVLSFIPSVPVAPQQSYTITVKNDLKSLSGKPLTGDKRFSTTAEKLKILWSAPGYKYKEKNYGYFSDDNVPPEAAKELRVQFNYLIKAEDIKNMSVITVGNNNITDFTVTQESKDTVTYHINAAIPTETKITLTVAGTASTSYSTVKKFEYDFFHSEPSYSTFSNPVTVYFTHEIDQSSILDNISTSLDYKITNDNLKLNGYSFTLYGLPVTFNSTYKLNLGSGIRDIYGRSLGKKITLDVEVPDADSNVNFPDYGVCILESEYPHTMVFEHQNIEKNSKYAVDKTDNPLNTKYEESFFTDDNSVELDTEPRNIRVLEKVDLEPYLTNGRGMIKFQAAVNIPITKYDGSKDTYTYENSSTVQVTNLGVTARIGINKSAVLVSRLSDGLPVKNATVYLYNSESYNIEQGKKDGSYKAKAVTDDQGLAVLEYNPVEMAPWFSDYNITPTLLVETDDDKVAFVPKSHSSWREGISTDNIGSALEAVPKTFMFSDRGLYKPGETVTFRGIDKNLNLGSYVPYEGNYKITIKDNNWDDITVEEGENLSGATSSSGGFYGSFKLPEKADPGYYTIVYERLEGDIEQKEQLPFTVSYFEKLKFQAAVSMPTVDIIAGEPINCNIAASYLAGGVLSSASYSARWYSEPWYFETNEPEFKDFVFGPLNHSENMNYLDFESGNLNGSGNAVLKCETTDQSVKGAPYRYKVSADVTDVSNQNIFTSATKIVHPGNYYIGLSKKSGAGYLIPKNQEVKFDYKLALPDGTAAEYVNKIAGKGKKLKIELLHDDWNTVHQQGINRNIYTRYEKEIVTESESTINLSKSGTISVTPKNVGYYTVRVSSTDCEDREIITEYSFFSTGSTSSWVMNSTEDSLKLTPDKNLYNPGDTATILLESPLPKGTYLITVEREGIFTEELRTFESAVNTIEIPIARNYVPVCYVSVSSYSVRTKYADNEYGVPDVDKPKGYYGVTAIHVNPYVKAFSVDVETEKTTYKPGEEATITVTATKGGEPLADAEITLMAVDRGVLDLIDYHVQNPIKYFYDEGNFPLRVRGGDDRYYLMDPVTYEVKNLAGGDALMAESAMDKLNERKDFNPTALFKPVVITDENGKATCTFKLPDSLTTYRITAFGVKDDLLALQENEFQVHNPINVQQVTPRRLRERDTSELGVILTNLDVKPHEVNISLDITSPENIESDKGMSKLPGKAFVDGESSHKVKVLPGSTIAVYFDVAAEKAGIINTEFTVTSDILNEKLIYPLTIEKPYIFEQVTSTGSIIGDNKESREGIIIPSFAENGLGSLTLTLDATRLGPLGSSVKYLFDYPYGCIEQQASRILPLIIFEDYIDVFNMDLDEKITDVHDLVKTYFKDWAKYQHSDGGFGYWPDSIRSSYYVSTRVAQNCAMALERGYSKKDIQLNIDNLIAYLVNNLTANIEKRDSDDYVKLSSYEISFVQYILSMLSPEDIEISNIEKILEDENSSISELAFGGLTALELENKQLAEKFKSLKLQSINSLDQMHKVLI